MQAGHAVHVRASFLLAALLSTASLLPGSATALEASTTLEFSGTGTCDICGSAVFACVQAGAGTWNDGVLPFVDPLPAGDWEITEVGIAVSGALECNTGVILGVALNSTSVGATQAPSAGCACNSCETLSFAEPLWFGSYTFGGSNSVQVIASDDTCVANVELTLTYQAAAVGDDDDAADDDDTADDDDAADDDDSASGDDDDGGGRGGGGRRGCNAGTQPAPSAGLSALVGLVLMLRRRRSSSREQS